MRTRRHFQPMLDAMPYRISPSAMGGVTATTTTASPSGTVVAYDTEGPAAATDSPTILAPVTPPTTLPC
jgi:hypothetical protein